MTDTGPSAGDYVRALPQYVLPQHLVSKVFHRATRWRLRAWKDRLIGWFINHYGVDMSLAREPDPSAYPDFNSFFTRALRPDARPLNFGVEDIACPVDGAISEVGHITAGRLLQAKGRHFSLAALLADAAHGTTQFEDGEFITLYLSPRDYHRIHMPLTGRLETMTYVPGRLFSVNQSTTRVIANLFARNERVICTFSTDAGPMAMILVGAINVGSIETVWAGPITPPYGKRVQRWRYPDASSGEVELERGAEMGRFNMGSTVIVLFGRGRTRWEDTVRSGGSVIMGQQLGRRLNV